MPRSILGKMARAAAAVAVPAAFESQKADIQAARDAMLQSYAEKAAANQQQFQTSEREAGQQFTAQQNAPKLALEAGQLAQTSRRNDIDEQQVKNQGEQLGIQKDQAKVAIQKINQELQLGEITLKQAHQLETVRDELVAADSPEKLNSAWEKYSALSGKADSNNFEAVTLYGPENDLGQQTKATKVLDKRTGKFSGDGPAPGEQSGQGAKLDSSQVMQDLIHSPTPENIAWYDKNVAKKAGAAQALLDQYQQDPSKFGGKSTEQAVQELSQPTATPKSPSIMAGVDTASAPAPAPADKKGKGWEPKTGIGMELLGRYHGRMGMKSENELQDALTKLGKAYADEVNRGGVESMDAKGLLKEINSLREYLTK